MARRTENQAGVCHDGRVSHGGDDNGRGTVRSIGIGLGGRDSRVVTASREEPGAGVIFANNPNRSTLGNSRQGLLCVW